MLKGKFHRSHSLLVLCTLLIVAIFSGCQNKTPRTFGSTSSPYPIQLLRFEHELFADTTANDLLLLQSLSQKYGEFYLSYVRDIMSMPITENDPEAIKPMSMARHYKPFILLQKTIDSTFGQLDELHQTLSLAMGIYAAEFKSAKVPAFVTFLSEYGYANVGYDTIIGIGLDMYMNETQSEFYRALSFPEFMIRKLKKEYIAPNTIKAMGINRYEWQTSRDKRFLAQMLFEGKVRYFMKALLPQTHDTLIYGYTEKQLQWCHENKAEIWAHFIEKNLLYNDLQNEYMRYFNDGPFTSADGVPPESAPAIAVYLGTAIIEKYMIENPSVTLEQLMNDTHFDDILKKSKFRADK
jgi:hypothetical protein